jgi:hypothetical protein
MGDSLLIGAGALEEARVARFATKGKAAGRMAVSQLEFAAPVGCALIAMLRPALL